MMHTNNQIIQRKIGLLNLAKELQKVSRVCEELMPISNKPLFIMRFNILYLDNFERVNNFEKKWIVSGNDIRSI